jgi:S-(hydroxymethyl)glutathione dehydrogenase / alcohol dehydrogenase
MKTKGALVWDFNQPQKRERALEFGADPAHADSESAMALIAGTTPGSMCPKGIITVGRADGADVQSWPGLRQGRRVRGHGDGQPSGLRDHHERGLPDASPESPRGSIFGGGNPQFDIPELLTAYRLGQLNLDDMVTRTYTLAQITDGYRDMLEGRNIPGVIRYTDADRA